MQQPWRSAWRLSRPGDAAERFLDRAGFDRAPWLVVALAGGIAAWFVLPSPETWAAAILYALAVAAWAALAWRQRDDRALVRRAVASLHLVFAFGIALVWLRSEVVGAEPIALPQVAWIDGRVIAREDRPAEGRVRVTLAYRDGDSGTARKARVNIPYEKLGGGLAEGARVRVRARLMPPAPPMVPGAYDFARTAWFMGLSATGSAVGAATTIEPAPGGASLRSVQRSLSSHVNSRLEGSAGAIAAAFASGDRGAIAPADEEAMRDSGLTHLLSISGLHVSAVVAGVYILALRLLALWPWFALRVRLPLVAAACGAGAGIGYTLLTGAEVPTVRSCIGALLVLAAMALGREPLSMRMVAAAGAAVMLLWPEAVVGPSFQMSFAAVVAIVALYGCAPVRAFLAPREESAVVRGARRLAILFATGIVIELALMPIVLFHFHRAGFYGSLANMVAIPLVTFITMPLIALALALDAAGAGAPAWWLVGQSLDLLLGIARFVAAQPGAVKLMPQMGAGTFTLFLAGLLWLALWTGRLRLAGLVPIAAATTLLLATRAPDVLVSSDGRHVGIAGEGGRLIVLRQGRSTFASDILGELAGVDGEPIALSDWPGARCSEEFCAIRLVRDGRATDVLIARTRTRVPTRDLSAACALADVVVADRRLPSACRPRWAKIDRALLLRTGGLSLSLSRRAIQTVADGQGAHPWWLAQTEAGVADQLAGGPRKRAD